MGSSQQSSQQADIRDAYRNGFIDGMVYQRGADKPTEAQFAQAVDVLVGCRASLEVHKQKTADIRLEHLAGLNLLRMQLSELV